MTEIEQKALALVNEVIQEVSSNTLARLDPYSLAHEAVRRAIEQHEAFKREVSDAIQSCMLGPVAEERLSPFILPKPVDPLVDAIQEADEVETGWARASDYAEHLRAALAKRGLKIVEVE